jgi:predicted CxxxxCH...CXXCH cytochrome family protein
MARQSSAVRGLLVLVAGVGLLVVSGCSGQDGAATSAGAARKSAPAGKAPRLAAAPKSPRLMQVYFNTQNGREWIYDGAGWVPHDKTIDDVDSTTPRVQPGTALGSTFVPTGAHPKHHAYECTVCHQIPGEPCFNPTGPAASPGKTPSFDATTKTCSNIACHGAYSGTFTYTRWDYGIDDIEIVTVPYASSGGTAASWYTTGSTSTCTSCHGNPPAAVNSWHSPTHAIFMATGRKCEICHADATSAVVAGKTIGVAIPAAYAALHGNGIVTVQAKFSSQCFGCH